MSKYGNFPSFPEKHFTDSGRAQDLLSLGEGRTIDRFGVLAAAGAYSDCATMKYVISDVTLNSDFTSKTCEV